MRKAFNVLINDHIYDVYDIEGKEHEGYNSAPKTWWVHYSKKETFDVNSKDLVPWDVSIQRLVWDIRFKQKNYY